MKALVLEKDAQQSEANTQKTLRVKNAGRKNQPQRKKGKLEQLILEEERKTQEEEKLRNKILSLRDEHPIILMSEDGKKLKEYELRWEIEKEILALGYIFCPPDEKLVDYFLRKKYLDKHFHFSCIMQIDVYGRHPRCLLETYRSCHAAWNAAYFFTRSFPDCTQPSTDVQEGHWNRGGETEIIYEGVKLGVKQKLVYCGGHWISTNNAEGDVKQELDCCEGDHKTKYTMIVYRLDPPPTNNLKDGPWFICKLYDARELGEDSQ